MRRLLSAWQTDCLHRTRQTAEKGTIMYRILFLSLAFLALAVAPSGTVSSHAATRSFAKANADTIHAYIVLLRLRSDLYLRWKATGKWPDDAAANAALAAHSRYWDEQLRNGRAIFAGGMNGDYWDNAALIVIEASSQSDAEAIVKNDPAVMAYVFQAQVRPFDVLFVTNKFDSTSSKNVPNSN